MSTHIHTGREARASRRRREQMDRSLPSRSVHLAALLAMLTVLAVGQSSQGYIEAAYSLGRVVLEATNIVVVKVEKVDTERNLIIYRKVQDLKGQSKVDTFKHDIGKGGFHPREWQGIMATTQPGRIAVIFHNNAASETCIENYWYQCYPNGDWWKLVHAEPYLLRTYAGKPEKLIPAVTAMLAGQEVVIPCMVDGDKNALAVRSARIQRLKASMKLQDYNPTRDFVGWGNEEYKTIHSMPGFVRYASIARVDPAARGISATDFDGDGQTDLCLWGEEKVVLLQNAGNSFDEVLLGHTGGARAASWADYNGDGKPDLLLAAPTGPRLFTNLGGGKFRDDSKQLPAEPYYNLTAGAWIDVNADGRSDILLANGFLGLRLYRYKGPPAPATQPAAGAPLFEDISDKVGLGSTGIGSNLKGDHLAVTDVNGDGRPDFLYSAGSGLLVINIPQGFVESHNSGLQYKTGKVAPVFGDVDGDKSPDLFVPQAGSCRLFKNDGKGRFTDVTAQSGDLASFTAHATCAIFADFDKAGRQDLLVGCFRGANRFFRNSGSGIFTDAGEQIGLYQRIFNSRSLCVADLNKDGIPDLAMNNEGQESTVLLSAENRITRPK